MSNKVNLDVLDRAIKDLKSKYLETAERTLSKLDPSIIPDLEARAFTEQKNETESQETLDLFPRNRIMSESESPSILAVSENKNFFIKLNDKSKKQQLMDKYVVKKKKETVFKTTDEFIREFEAFDDTDRQCKECKDFYSGYKKRSKRNLKNCSRHKSEKPPYSPEEIWKLDISEGDSGDTEIETPLKKRKKTLQTSGLIALKK